MPAVTVALHTGPVAAPLPRTLVLTPVPIRARTSGCPEGTPSLPSPNCSLCPLDLFLRLLPLGPPPGPQRAPLEQVPGLLCPGPGASHMPGFHAEKQPQKGLGWSIAAQGWAPRSACVSSASSQTPETPDVTGTSRALRPTAGTEGQAGRQHEVEMAASGWAGSASVRQGGSGSELGCGQGWGRGQRVPRLVVPGKQGEGPEWHRKSHTPVCSHHRLSRLGKPRREAQGGREPSRRQHGALCRRLPAGLSPGRSLLPDTFLCPLPRVKSSPSSRPPQAPHALEGVCPLAHEAVPGRLRFRGHPSSRSPCQVGAGPMGPGRASQASNSESSGKWRHPGLGQAWGLAWEPAPQNLFPLESLHSVWTQAPSGQISRGQVWISRPRKAPPPFAP